MWEPLPEGIQMPWWIEGLEVVDGNLHVIGPHGEYMVLYPHDLANLGLD